jgi:hypothetical protein
MYNKSHHHSHHHRHASKDTPAHDSYLDDTNNALSKANADEFSTMNNDLTSNNSPTTSMATMMTIAEDDASDDEPRFWTRTDQRLRDVQSECHPEVFECWKEVDADLDKVEQVSCVQWMKKKKVAMCMYLRRD